VIDGGPGPTATELYALIDLHCSSATACGCAWAVVEEDACVPELETRWKARLSEAQRRELRYDAECFASLSAQIDQWRCYWPGGDIPLCDGFCAPFHGDRAEGDDCEGDDALVSDCAQGLVCREGTCTAPCAALDGRQQGEVCGNELQGNYDDCAAGLWCSWSGICEVAPAAGDPCFEGNCGDELYCDWNTSTCVARPGEGELCWDTPCADGLYCDWQTKAEPPYCRRFAQEGEPCDQRECADELWCIDGLRCVAAPEEGEPCLFGSVCADGIVCQLESGLCVAPPEEGQPCVENTCASGSWCDTAMDPTGVGICAPRLANDEMCSGHRQCQSGYCPNGFCWPVPLEGEGCEGAGLCAGGLVCNGTTCEPTLTRAPAACIYPGW
jgi:hypothetical protein